MAHPDITARDVTARDVTARDVIARDVIARDVIARDVIAIVPLKALGQAKGRMAFALDAGLRLEAVAWMLDRVLAALAGARGVAQVLVVAGDAAGVDLVGDRADRVLLERTPGLVAALGAADAATRLAGATMVLAADLPLVTADEVDAVCGAGVSGPCVVLVATRDGGTGALLRRPGHAMGTAYGPRSAIAHLALARAAGLRVQQLDLPGLAFDVDTPDALRNAGFALK